MTTPAKWLAGLVVLAIAGAAADDRASSDKQSPGSVDAIFKSLDRNRDQGISRIEAKADRTIFAAFDSADINLDGYISKPEYVAFLQLSSERETKP